MKIKNRIFSNRKSQAAMEFLTTYGWAILAALVAVSVFAYFGLTKPEKTLPDYCRTSSEVTCTGYQISQTGPGMGTLKVVLLNNMGQSITISAWNVSSTSQVPLYCTSMPSPLILGEGQTGTFDFSGCNNNQAGFKVGQSGQVNFNFNYYLAQSGSSYFQKLNGEFRSTVLQIANISVPQCSDNADNDNNGCKDYAEGDTGCSSSIDSTEGGGQCPAQGGSGMPLYCYVSTYCPDTMLFRIFDLKDSHAEIPTLTNYDYKVCCKSATTTLSNSCAGAESIPLHLSNNSNAHVEKNTQTRYNINTCLSANPGTISCSYVVGNCAVGDVCLATIDSDTDSHVGDCITQPFATKICCRIS